MNRHTRNTASKPLRSEFAANVALQAQVQATQAIVFPPPSRKEGLSAVSNTVESGRPTSGIEVGSILVSSWGYEQTNYDFYKVKKLTESNGQRWVTIAKLKATKTEYDSQQMAGLTIPGDTEEDAKTLRRRLIKGCSGEGFQIRPRHGWCSLWDGQPKRFTTYG